MILFEKLQDYFEYIAVRNSTIGVLSPFAILHILIISFCLGLITLGLAIYYLFFIRLKKIQKQWGTFQPLSTLMPDNG